MLHNGPKVLYGWSVIPSACLQDGASPEKQEQGVGSSKIKAKGVELPIFTCTVRQLDRELLNCFVDEEVSFYPVTFDSPERKHKVGIAIFISEKQSYIALKDAGVLFRAQRINISISWQ